MNSVKDDPKRAGFPHSDIFGSKLARSSPKLFAACHVLHRLLAPRHPPDALSCLRDRSTSRAGARRIRRSTPLPQRNMSQRRRHVTAHIHRGPSRRRPKATARSARLHAERCRVTASCSRHHAFADVAGSPTRPTARCLPPLHHVEQQRSDDERRPGSHDRIKGLTNNVLYIYAAYIRPGFRPSRAARRRRQRLRIFAFDHSTGAIDRANARPAKMVEANGIEPMTSGLQSRRSPS